MRSILFTAASLVILTLVSTVDACKTRLDCLYLGEAAFCSNGRCDRWVESTISSVPSDTACTSNADCSGVTQCFNGVCKPLPPLEAGAND